MNATAIYVHPCIAYDTKFTQATNKHKWCHMTCEGVTATDIAELIALAESIGCKRAWIQHAGDPVMVHFDLTPYMRGKAIASGAINISIREYGGLILRKRAALSALKGGAA